MEPGERYNPFGLFHGVYIPEWLSRRSEVSPGAKLIFGRLARYAGHEGVATPDQGTLGAEIGVGRQQAVRYCRELAELGLIVKLHRPNQTNAYGFLWHQWILELTSNSSSGSTTSDTPGSTTSGTPLLSTRSKSVKNLAPRSAPRIVAAGQESTGERPKRSSRWSRIVDSDLDGVTPIGATVPSSSTSTSARKPAATAPALVKYFLTQVNSNPAFGHRVRLGINQDALRGTFTQWKKNGMEPEQIREMIDLFCAEPQRQRRGVPLHKSFIMARVDLADKTMKPDWGDVETTTSLPDDFFV